MKTAIRPTTMSISSRVACRCSARQPMMSPTRRRRCVPMPHSSAVWSPCLTDNLPAGPGDVAGGPWPAYRRCATANNSWGEKESSPRICVVFCDCVFAAFVVLLANVIISPNSLYDFRRSYCRQHDRLLA